MKFLQEELSSEEALLVHTQGRFLGVASENNLFQEYTNLRLQVKPRKTPPSQLQLCACAERRPRLPLAWEPPSRGSLCVSSRFRPVSFSRSTAKAGRTGDHERADGGPEAWAAAAHRPRRPAWPSAGFLQVGAQG